MKKILLICLLSVNLFAQTVYTPKNTELKDGVVISIDTKEPINGIVKLYYMTGEFKVTVPFKDGKVNGMLIYYNIKGKIVKFVVYKEGKQNGMQKNYLASGELEAEITFKDGKKNGMKKMYYRSGELS